MDNIDDEMRLPEEGTPTGAGPGTGVNASGQRPRNSRRLGRGNPEIQSTGQRSQTTSGSPPAEGAALYTEELTQAGLPRRRIKWTYDMNVSVMRAFFKATRGGAEVLHYRQQMRHFFLLDYPDLSHLTQQNLADRKRAIERRNLIPPTLIEQIRREVHGESTQQPLQETLLGNTTMETSANAAQPVEMVLTNDIIPTMTIHQDDSSSQHGDNVNVHTEELTTSILNTFNTAKAQFMGMNPEHRPYLPKPIINKKLNQIVNILNTTILPPEITQNTQYHHIIDLIYCSAYTIVTTQNSRRNNIHQTSNTRTRTVQQRQGAKPQWQTRLEKKIESIRKDLGYLTSYKNGLISNKKRNKFDGIKKRHLVHTGHEPRNETIVQIIDTVKQKLDKVVDKYRRYTKSYKRKTHNSIFASSEKRFYNMLKNPTNNNNTVDITGTPMTAIEAFWSKIWSSESEHNRHASWLGKIMANAESISGMTTGRIDNEIFKKAISRLHNWKQPGPDKIHNFYYKYLQSLHDPLLSVFNTFLENPNQIPPTMCKGITYLKPKIDRPTSPSQFRPITCLNTGYKLFTACLTNMINLHCNSNNIISEQQKGCRIGTKGCKDQLIIDSIIINQAIREKKNMYAAFIDYQKAFDSIPHSWLIEVLRIYKIHANIIECFVSMTKTWSTRLILNNSGVNQTSGTIAIKRGIYQGDSLSPLLFCLALNPLSHLLETSKYGYQLRTTGNGCRISHSLYVDDLKLYAGTRASLENLLRIVEIFTDDVNMKFGIEKCRTQSIHKGKFSYTDNYTTSHGEHIAPLTTEECYKYLGVQQSSRIEHTIQKKTLTAEFIRRMHRICKMKLNGYNITKAINTYAIPLLTYSFGIVTWSKTDLNALDCRIRTILTNYGYHHPKSAVERVNLPRRRGGRGILSICLLHDKQVNSLKKYFSTAALTHTLYSALEEADDNLTPLNLKSRSMLQVTTLDDLETSWKSKIIHGRYPNEITQEYIDIPNTHRWLTCGALFAETEGHIFAIQDSVICTRNYRKYIIKDQNINTDLCRMCGIEQETISHIISGCTTMAASHYKIRHDLMGKILHMEVAKQYKLINETAPYYEYKPQPVLANEQITIYWDRSILMDVAANGSPIPNRPDMIILNKPKKTAVVIDFANPRDGNIISTRDTKIRKYHPLSQYLKRSQDLDTVAVLAIIISSTGTIPKTTTEAIKYLNLNQNILAQMQKAVLIKTSSIVREVLEYDIENTGVEPGLHSFRA